MPKHKIVRFINDIAKVEITDDFMPYLLLEDRKTLFVNPDLRYVRGVSPEFWTVKDEVIWPLEGQELEDRKHILEVQGSIILSADLTSTQEILLKLEENEEEIKHLEKVITNINDKHMELHRIAYQERNANMLAINGLIQAERDISDAKLKTLNKKWVIYSVVSAITFLALKFL